MSTILSINYIRINDLHLVKCWGSVIFFFLPFYNFLGHLQGFSEYVTMWQVQNVDWQKRLCYTETFCVVWHEKWCYIEMLHNVIVVMWHPGHVTYSGFPLETHSSFKYSPSSGNVSEDVMSTKGGSVKRRRRVTRGSSRVVIRSVDSDLIWHRPQSDHFHRFTICMGMLGRGGGGDGGGVGHSRINLNTL